MKVLTNSNGKILTYGGKAVLSSGGGSSEEIIESWTRPEDWPQYTESMRPVGESVCYITYDCRERSNNTGISVMYKLNVLMHSNTDVFELAIGNVVDGVFVSESTQEYTGLDLYPEGSLPLTDDYKVIRIRPIGNSILHLVQFGDLFQRAIEVFGRIPDCTYIRAWSYNFPMSAFVESYDVYYGPVSSLTSLTSRSYLDHSLLKNINLKAWASCPITNLSGMLSKSDIESVDLSIFNNIQPTLMDSMFHNCKSLRSVNLNGIDTSKVTNFGYMFEYCQSLRSIDVSNLDLSSVTTISGMFIGCSGLETIDVSNWNTSSVQSYADLFNGCTSLKAIDVSNWDTDKASNFASMFNGCNNLQNIDVSNFNTAAVQNMSYMFCNCISLQSIDVSNFNTSSCDNMRQMFYNCSLLKNLDLSSFDTSNVTSMASMFSGNNKCMRYLNLSSFTWDSITSNQYPEFTWAKSLEILVPPTNGWYAYNTSFVNATMLTHDSIVALLNSLPTASCTLTLGATNLAKLTDAEKAIATNKGWTLA